MMNSKMRIWIAVVLIGFSSYTAWIAWEFGYVSVFSASFSTHPTTQVFLDLCISVGLLALVMMGNNQRNGRSFRKLLPFLLVTLFLGSIGPLLYFAVYTDTSLLRTPFSPRTNP